MLFVYGAVFQDGLADSTWGDTMHLRCAALRCPRNATEMGDSDNDEDDGDGYGDDDEDGDADVDGDAECCRTC